MNVSGNATSTVASTIDSIIDQVLTRIFVDFRESHTPKAKFCHGQGVISRVLAMVERKLAIVHRSRVGLQRAAQNRIMCLGVMAYFVANEKNNERHDRPEQRFDIGMTRACEYAGQS